jgi:hypothetical protein
MAIQDIPSISHLVKGRSYIAAFIANTLQAELKVLTFVKLKINFIPTKVISDYLQPYSTKISLEWYVRRESIYDPLAETIDAFYAKQEEE